MAFTALTGSGVGGAYQAGDKWGYQTAEKVRGNFNAHEAALAELDASIMRRATKSLTNAQIIALPTTAIQLVASPGSGFRIRVFAVSMRKNTTSGAYSGINTTYAGLMLRNSAIAGKPLAAIENDSSFTTDLTALTTLLGSADSRIVDIQTPYIVPIDAGATSGDEGYIKCWVASGTSDFDDHGIELFLDNNGSGNLGGGHVNNSLLVTTYYTVEAV